MCNPSAWLDALARHAAERPTAVAVAEVSSAGEVTRIATWREFVAAAGVRTRALADVVPLGATVLAAWPSGIDLAAWFAGAIAAGVRLVLMHPRCGAGECAAVCARANAKAVLAAESLLERIPDTVVRIGNVLLRLSEQEGVEVAGQVHDPESKNPERQRAGSESTSPDRKGAGGGCGQICGQQNAADSGPGVSPGRRLGIRTGGTPVPLSIMPTNLATPGAGLRLGSRDPLADARGSLASDPGSIILGSSGTTGLPKLVLRESAALDADARAVAAGLSLTMDDCVLCVPPLCHSYGVDMLLGTLFAGATLRVMAEFDPTGVARQLASGVTVLPGLPFVYESLARLEGVGGAAVAATDEPRPAHGLRVAVSAGSPLSARVRREFTDRWKIEIGQLYGATELGTVSVSIPGEIGFDTESVGRPLAGVSFRVVDVDDPTRVLAGGEEGQLAVKSPSMLSGYVDGELSLVDGHLLTGDLARLDEQGRATITGRLKLLIDTGGFKVNPLEVEATLLEHPGVAECAVVPLALSDTIHRSLALIVARDAERPPSDSELRRFLRERLAPIKIPRSFEMVASLPRSPLGKLLRDQLPKRSIASTLPTNEPRA